MLGIPSKRESLLLAAGFAVTFAVIGTASAVVAPPRSLGYSWGTVQQISFGVGKYQPTGTGTRVWVALEDKTMGYIDGGAVRPDLDPGARICVHVSSRWIGKGRVLRPAGSANCLPATELRADG